MQNLRVCSLVSGGGTTMQAILQMIRRGKLEGIHPALVIASKPGISAIQKAFASGMSKNDVVVICKKDFSQEEDFGQAILNECNMRGVNFIGQYGWLPHTPLNLVKAFRGRIINQHPAPLDPGYPDFGGRYMYGLAAVAARFRFAQLVGDQAMWTEATVHHVVDEMDKGKLIATRRLEILPTDTPETLQGRLLPLEWELQVKTLEAFARRENTAFVRQERLVPRSIAYLLEEAKAWGIEYAKNH